MFSRWCKEPYQSHAANELRGLRLNLCGVRAQFFQAVDMAAFGIGGSVAFALPAHDMASDSTSASRVLVLYEMDEGGLENYSAIWDGISNKCFVFIFRQSVLSDLTT